MSKIEEPEWYPYKPHGNVGTSNWSVAERPGDNPNPMHGGRFRSLASVNGVGGANFSGPYEPVLGWPEPAHPGEWRTGSGRGVYAESPDRVIAVYGGELPVYDKQGVFGANVMRDLRFVEINSRFNPDHRHCHEIVVYDGAGRILDDWDRHADALHENDLRRGAAPHSGYINRIRVNRYDPERHIWILGQGDTGIFKFTNDGAKIVLKLDSNDVPEQYQPLVFAQDIAFLPNGEFIIAHRHTMMKYSADGEFLAAFGKPGNGPVEFDGVHGIEVHPLSHHLYINDRVNQRIHIIDADGNFVDAWPGFQGNVTIRLTKEGDYLWVGNGFGQKFMKYDMQGRLIRQATWGTFGIAPGTFWGPHYFDTDSEGNLYIAEDYSGRVQKLRPADDIDSDDPQLIGDLNR